MKLDSGAITKYEIVKEKVRSWLFIWIFYATVSTLKTRDVSLNMAVNREIMKNLE
jgi:hypothetical protein